MSKKTSRFGSNVTADVERRKREGSSYGYLKLPQNVNVFKESAGKLKLDIIPYIVTDENHMDGNPKYPDSANPGNPWYKKPILVHRSVGAENQSIVCPRTQGKKCPVCEQRAKQQSQGVEKDDLIPKPQLRNLYVVIPIGHKEYEEKFHVWDISNGNFQKKLDEELSEDPEVGSFPDPEEGKTLQVRFSEETFNKNKYFEATRIDFEERDGYDEKIMEQAPNLDEVITILSYKEIEKMFLEIDEEEEEDDSPKVSMRKKKKVVETEEEEDDEEEEEEAPRKKKKVIEEESHPFRKKKVAKPEPEPEEEVEEEETEEEEEEVEEAPAIRRKKKKAPEPEPEEEEEEEEKEAPQPTRKGKKQAAVSSEECPAGYEFGSDWDGYDDCDDCKLFAACGKAHEKK